MTALFTILIMMLTLPFRGWSRSVLSVVSHGFKAVHASHVFKAVHATHIPAVGLIVCATSACTPEPPLHLYDQSLIESRFPLIDLNLSVYWDYKLDYNIKYDWRDEWYYGWDDEDQRIFGNIGYTEPNTFNLRRYYTGDTPYGPHLSMLSSQFTGTSYRGRFNWGWWDMLIWNEVQTLDGIQSLIFDDSSMDSVVAYTNQTMIPTRYQAPRQTHAYYEPEGLFAAYDQGVEISEDLHGFEYDSINNVWWRKLKMTLYPITYIYLTQVILHHNNGRITGLDGNTNLSGMAYSTNLNTGRAGDEPITVHYSARLKNDVPYIPYSIIDTLEANSTHLTTAERVDIAGGRLLTFGICGLAANSITSEAQVRDRQRHYMDITMQFKNGADSTFVFDVTNQVRRRYKGGVITVELDMDTVPTPTRRGGSGFNAVVKDIEDGGTYIFDM